MLCSNFIKPIRSLSPNFLFLPGLQTRNMNSSAIEIQTIEGKGKGYIAKRDIKIGERLLEEDPLTATYK